MNHVFSCAGNVWRQSDKTFDAQGRDLNKRLVILSDAGHIDSRLLKWAHEIRLVGNEAAHEIEAPVTKEDARDILDFTEAILIYIFSLTKRFDSLRARRNKSAKRGSEAS